MLVVIIGAGTVTLFEISSKVLADATMEFRPLLELSHAIISELNFRT